tara:strand:+ start:171 stop:446 length:276 start_codon:yes stop_codon:yes gene_type:complete
MSIGAFQSAISQKFPTKKNEQIYLYTKFGKLLFKDEWTTLKLPFIDDTNISDKDMPQLFIGVMSIMKNFTREEKCIICNYIFQEAVKSLSN